MAEFYEHPASGDLYLRAPAGGGTSVFDARATEADIAANPAAYRDYLAAKAAVAPMPEALAKPVPEVQAADIPAAAPVAPQPIIGAAAKT